MNKKNIEQRIGEQSPLFEFFGKELTEELKHEIKNVIVDRVRDDLEQSGTWIITEDDFTDIVNEARDEVYNKIKKMYKDAYLQIAQEAINKSLYGESTNEKDTKES